MTERFQHYSKAALTDNHRRLVENFPELAHIQAIRAFGIKKFLIKCGICSIIGVMWVLFSGEVTSTLLGAVIEVVLATFIIGGWIASLRHAKSIRKYIKEIAFQTGIPTEAILLPKSGFLLLLSSSWMLWIVLLIAAMFYFMMIWPFTNIFRARKEYDNLMQLLNGIV